MLNNNFSDVASWSLQIERTIQMYIVVYFLHLILAVFSTFDEQPPEQFQANIQT